MKKIIKILTIILMVAISMLAMGCESQEEKFDKVDQKIINKVNNFRNLIRITPKETESIKQYIPIHEKFLEEHDALVKELEKIAKGNPKLEARAKMRRESIDRDKHKWPETKQLLKEKYNIP